MKRLRRSVAAVAAVTLATGALTALWPVTAGATYSPPWGSTDTSSVGGINLYNAAGVQITGGNTSDAPLAAFVEGDTTVRAGDTKATLYGYLPVNGTAPGSWSGEQISSSTSFPNGAAPGPLSTATLPVVTGGSSDLTLATLATDFPNNDVSADGYAGLYVVRLKTSAAGKGSTSTYDSTVIQITGSTWTVLSPAPTISTTSTSMSVTQSSPQVSGTSVQLNAQVTAGIPGTVQFKTGTTDLGSAVAVAVDGTAHLTTAALPVGTDSLSAVFTPAPFIAYSGSTGTTSFTISAGGPTLTPTTPTVSNLPASGRVGGSFVASVSTNGDGVKSVTSSSTGICSVGIDGLTVTYLAVGTCSLTAHVAGGSTYLAADGSAQTFAVAAAAYPYHPITPTRICDTRAAGPSVVANQCDHSGASPGSLGAGGIINVTVADGVTVPANAAAVLLNVTAANTTAGSFLTIWPKGATQPTTSNLNWKAGIAIPNLVEVPVGAGGQVSIFNSAGAADVIVDVEGYVGPSSAAGAGLYEPLAPARICDTRAVGTSVSANQCNNNGASPGTLAGGGIIKVQITGTGGVPASGVAAVALNVTVTGTTTGGFLTAWPDGLARPTASNLNWKPGVTIPNRVVVPVGANGQIDLYNSAGSTNVIVDVTGWFTDSSNAAATGSLYVALNPARICDTRAVGGGIPSNQCDSSGPGTLSAGATKAIGVTGFGGVPAGATAAVLNVTVTGTTTGGFLSVWPDDGSPVPTASDLNWSPTKTIANLVFATLPTSGARPGVINVFNSAGSTNVIVDVEGYYVPSGS